MKITYFLIPRALRNRVTGANLSKKTNALQQATATRDRSLIAMKGLFDKTFYLERYPDVLASGIDPLTHFIEYGWSESRDPSATFSTSRYLADYPDVAASGRNPLAHYAEHGIVEGRSINLAANPADAIQSGQPEPANLVPDIRETLGASGLFDTAYYAVQNPDVIAAGLDPLFHFMSSGETEGRNPHPLFNLNHYRRLYPGVAAAGTSMLLEYVESGGTAGRSPHPDFDGRYYLERYHDVAAACTNPLVHYLRAGAGEGRDPSPSFHTNFYLATNPDVAASGVNPLVHYVLIGRAEGRRAHPAHSFEKAVSGATPVERLIGRYEEAGAVGAAALLDLSRDGLSAVRDAFLPNVPLNAVIDPELLLRPTLRILCPSLQMRHATGCPNTIFIVGCALAAKGVRVAFLSTEVPLEADLEPIKSHMALLSGIDPDANGVTLVDASDRDRPMSIGLADTFMATAWWTAQPARDIARMTRNPRIFYLIQDYETLFYGASENYAQAEETYSFDHVPIINTSLLRDHLVAQGVGRFTDPIFGRDAFVFEPAVDTRAFHPMVPEAGAPRRLLFYARPNSAKRNLFSLGVAALRAAVEAGVFHGSWEFLGMGDHFEPVPLGRGNVLRPAPWLDFVGYAQQMASSDLVLSLMLSPHPSYPPLEAAACGVHAVTSEFGVKTKDRLSQLSPNIIGVPPRVDALLAGLTRAVTAADAVRHVPRRSRLNMPTTWIESLAPIVSPLVDVLRGLDCVRHKHPITLLTPTTLVRTSPEVPGSPVFYSERLFRRAREYREASTPGLISLITTVYDTKASFLSDLAHTVFGQDTTLPFEWLILDNGSSDLETLACLAQIGRHPYVRLERVDRNLGIVGGMRWCLENARLRYVLPLDSDDLLFPDCIRSITAFLEQTGFPKAIYTNEDKTDGLNNFHPYLKPDWDPVLFMHSCYVAHLTALDRITALQLGCYTAPQAEGCHDWDTFSRLLFEEIKPLHLPEILYTWRMHAGSTSENHSSKPYIQGSHRFVLERFLAKRSMLDTHEVVDAPLFGTTADYRFALRESTPHRQIPEFILSSHVKKFDLAQFCIGLEDTTEYILLRDPDCIDVAETSEDEALTLAQAFPDAVIIGGRIHDGARIIESGYVFGYRGLIGCPDVGRSLADPGYFAQSWKPHSVAAVSARLAVVSRAFLAEVLDQLPEELCIEVLGIWLGFAARAYGGRVVFSPYLSARTTAPPPILTSTQAVLLKTRYGRRDRDRIGYASHLDLTGFVPYAASGMPELTKNLPSYAAYQADEVACRLTDFTAKISTRASTISILTTVYVRTDVALFEETAASVLTQSHPVHEWVVLAHGPISPALDAALMCLESDPRMRILRLDTNLGIQGGLRYCLEHATGDFVASVDADDILTPDAVAAITSAAGQGAEILYSDEDLLVDESPVAPFYRPSFDPFLLFAHSTIWHLIVFQRKIGLSLGVYTAHDAEYAQDWDTLLRFVSAGYVPVHVKKVLYHWRRHASSISNSGSAFEGSGRSVKALLESVRQNAPRPDLLAVEIYPVDLGVGTLYLERARRDPPSLALLRVAERSASIGTFEFATISTSPPLRGPAGLTALAEVLGGIEAELILLVGQALHDIDELGLWQAVKQLELVESCIAVGGAVIDSGGRILAATPIQSNDGELIDPLVDLTIRDTGPCSLALLPHRVSAVTVDFVLVRRKYLEKVILAAPINVGLRSLGTWLGEYARHDNKLVAYEPLLRGTADRRSDLIGDDIEGVNRTVNSFGWFATGMVTPVIGLGGFIASHSIHSA